MDTYRPPQVGQEYTGANKIGEEDGRGTEAQRAAKTADVEKNVDYRLKRRESIFEGFSKRKE